MYSTIYLQFLHSGGYLGVSGTSVLKWGAKKPGMSMWIGLNWLGLGANSENV
jgi:hypothetical protein